MTTQRRIERLASAGNTVKDSPSILTILAEGLDQSVGGKGWGAEHERARILAEAAPAMFAALTQVRDRRQNKLLGNYTFADIEAENRAIDEALSITPLLDALEVCSFRNTDQKPCRGKRGHSGLHDCTEYLDDLQPPKIEHPPLRSLTEAAAHPKLNTRLYFETTLHVEVPTTIHTDDFETELDDAADKPGYDDLDSSGLLLDPHELAATMQYTTAPGGAEGSAELTAFFREVDRIRGDADRIYFHRGENHKAAPDRGEE